MSVIPIMTAPPRNGAREALTRAINRAIAEGAPRYVEVKAMFILRSIASAPDATGRYRMSVAALSTDITSLDDAMSLVEIRRLRQLGFSFEVVSVSHHTHAAALRGELNGYASGRSLDDPQTLEPWR